MAFKMKGPMFFGSAIKKYGKKSEPVAKMKGDLNKDGKMSDYEKNRQDAIDENMEKEGSGMNYGSPVKNRVTEGGKLVNHTHKDGSTHTYAAPKTRPDGTVAPGGTDEKGTITPATKMAHGSKDKKGGPKMKYGKKDPAPKMVHSGKKKKGGPKMKDKNPAPKMNYEKKKK
tara:strand:- start:53 stop:565 length:513 start_codon:yes stop_codon:yes gene_type:complete